jgi:ribose 5-phosphate isomerase B
MKIYIGSDHAGFAMKAELIEYLKTLSVECFDCGPYEYNHEDDYPDFVSQVAKEVSSDPSKNIGIIVGRNGQGEAIVANRFRNVRCMVFYGGSKHMITLGREHDDANMISFGSHFLTTQEAKIALELFLHTNFSGDERHVRRIKKIEQYD